MTRSDPSTTTWCQKHERIEAVKRVTKAHAFFTGPERVPAREVFAVTVTGCKVHFIGGAAR